MMLSDICLSDVCSVSVAYIGPKSRTERPRKTKIGTEVAHVTRDSDTTFKVRRSKVKDTGAGTYRGGLPHSVLNVTSSVQDRGPVPLCSMPRPPYSCPSIWTRIH